MSSLRFRVGQGLCLALLASFIAQAGPVPAGKPVTYPNWWFDHDVIPRLPAYSTTVPPVLTWPTHYPLSDDYAAANIGQLKFVAIKAAEEMTARLPSPGAGPDVAALLASWGSSTNRDDYAAFNLGQLKTVSIPFYDRLYDIGVRFPSDHKYPWQASLNPPDDYALVNLGQLKHVFGFRVPGGSGDAADTDGDGISDAWELLHFGNLIADIDADGLPDAWELHHFGNFSTTAVSDLDGDGRTNLQEYTDGTGPLVRDTDGDGLNDGFEAGYNLNPLLDDLLLVPTKILGRRLHLRADAGVPSSGAVTQWLDQSGLNNHASQNVDELKPQVDTSDFNNGQYPVVRFDDDQLNLPNIMNLPTPATAGEIIAVLKLSNQPRIDTIWNFGADSVGSLYNFNGYHENFGAKQYYGPVGPADPLALSTYHIRNTSSRGALLTLPPEMVTRLNGVTHFVHDAHTVEFRNMPVLGKMKGDIAELLVYDRVLTPHERESLNVYLARKYMLFDLPGTPTNLSAQGISATQACLIWSMPSVSDAFCYEIERSVGGVFVFVAEVEQSTSFIETSLPPGSTHIYRVRARNARGTSGPSSEVSVTLPLAEPSMSLSGLRLWLRADAFTPASGSISVWLDQSGRKNHARQIARTSPSQIAWNSRPQVFVNEANGRPVIRFDGQHDELQMPDFMNWSPALPAALAGEIIAVVKMTHQTGRGNTLWNFGTGSYGSLYNAQGYHENFGSNLGLGPVASSSVLTSYHINNVFSKPGELATLLNGSMHHVRTTNTVAFRPGPTLGAQGQSLLGDIAEVMLYDRVLSHQEREAVNAYLARKYALFALPEIPTNVTAQSISSSQVHLAWSVPVITSPHVYQIERKVGGVFTIIGEAQSSSFLDSTVAAGTTPTYRVIARNARGISAPSVEVSVTLPLAAVAMPLNGLRLWLRADAGVGSGGSWLDQSGLNNHATQFTPISKPSWIPNQANGRPIFRFHQNSYFNLPDLMNQPTPAQAGEIIAVVKALYQPTRKDMLWYFGTTATGSSYYPPYGRFDDFGSNSSYGSDSSSNSLGVVGLPLAELLNTYHIHNTSSKAGELATRFNATPHHTRYNNTVAFRSDPKLGGDGVNGLWGDIAEVMVYDRILSPSEREAVNIYLSKKYGILGDYLQRTDADMNGDGLADSINHQLGISSTNHDTDGDGLTNWSEIFAGTDPFKSDSDGDDVSDALDAFPLDPARSQAPGPVSGDTTPPVINLIAPVDAILLP